MKPAIAPKNENNATPMTTSNMLANNSIVLALEPKVDSMLNCDLRVVIILIDTKIEKTQPMGAADTAPALRLAEVSFRNLKDQSADLLVFCIRDIHLFFPLT